VNPLASAGFGRTVPTVALGALFASLVLAGTGCGALGANEPTAVSLRLEASDGSTNTANDDDDVTDQTSSVTNPDDGANDGGSGTAVDPPDWLGSRPLPTIEDGSVVPQTTPEELVDRRFTTFDTLPPPPGDEFEATISPLAGEPLDRSTWETGCPVPVDELRYLTMTFWGFDDRPHTGEMIVNASVADDVVAVFESIYDTRFPIEEMRIVTRADLDALPTGDGNMTTSFVCREVVGGSGFSQHAFGLAIDVNPFQNPYLRGEVVLPELATSYSDRTELTPGMHADGGPVVAAFDEIGWGWGGRWRTLKDYQHFSLNNR